MSSASINLRRSVLAIAGFGILGATIADAARPPTFEAAVAPIMEARCVECHNPGTRKGELDLSTAEGFLRGGESGEVIKPSEPEHSHLLELVRKGEMPKQGAPLTPPEIGVIRDWISAGAVFESAVVASDNDVNQHDVLPIVLLRCTVCHGARRRDGGLDLRTPEGMRKGGVSGPALVAGDPAASLMIRRIESEACPPGNLLLKYFVKRPSASEVSVLREWITAGAPEVDVRADVATREADPLVTDKDRAHWAFRAPRRDTAGRSIDDFVGEALAKRGLEFSPEEGRDSLIRRAAFDLTGLPPDPADWERWRSAESAGWYSRMIDELLSSPRYGERWGRYWLDVAGYADSEGGVSADPVREVAWKYRDYVIRAFNEDRPYDRFLREQLAGDELLDVQAAAVVNDEMVENLVATGFLRMGIDQTGSRTMNFVPERLGVISDAIAVVGSGVLGLTLECARCHTHKYDPIPHRDYYRLKAVFQGAFDEHDWLSFKNRSVKHATPERRRRVAAVNPPLLAKLKSLDSKLSKAATTRRLETLRLHYPELDEAERKAALVALRKADNQRSLPQRILVEKLQRAELVPETEQPEPVKVALEHERSLGREIAALRKELEPSLEIRALWDRGEPSPTYILRRGEHDKPGRLVGPGVPSVLTDGRTPFEVRVPFPDGSSKTGRRLAFARWLTEPDHPLTARVMVNRVWHHHFGRGLVATLENFGEKGARPSHPELLDWLAVEFVERGWSIKELHRLIMNSRAYRQTSRVEESRLHRDPQNVWLSRMPLRRLDAEALRDALLAVSGRLDERGGGPPDEMAIDREGLVSAEPLSNGRWRRSVYLKYRRTEIPTMMDTFDYPEMGPNCVERSVSTLSPQALMLMNNERVRELASSFARRVEQRAGPDPAGRVKAVYQLALSREPDSGELERDLVALRELRSQWSDDPGKALESYCHVVLNSAEFLHLD